jgi:uncharacterized protein (DUF697 family)
VTPIGAIVAAAIAVAITIALGLCDARTDSPKAQRHGGEENQLTH